MPHTRSAKKSLRKNRKRRLANRGVKKSLKTQIKQVLAVAESGAWKISKKNITWPPRNSTRQQRGGLSTPIWLHARNRNWPR